MDDLVKRLRKADEYEPLGHDAWEAAAALEAKDAEIAALRGALDDDAAREVDRLRLKAFATNSEADRMAYFQACSRWFQNRHRAALQPKD